MNKRGQTEQIFVYIFALVVAALIIGFGYYAITNLLNVGKQVETIKFKEDFEKEMKIYYSYAPGTNAYVRLSVPSGIKAVCFISEGSASKIQYADIKETAKVIQDKNIFFSTIKEKDFAEPIYVDQIKPSPDPLCINTLSGVLDIDILTTGRFVQIGEHQK